LLVACGVYVVLVLLVIRRMAVGRG
jgi:hypothetical protein